MNDKMLWHTCRKEELAKVILVGLQGLSTTRSSFPTPVIDAGKVLIGYSEVDVRNEVPSPALFIVSDSHYFDLFSWLSTYTPDIFPLTQFARVMSETDSRNFREISSITQIHVPQRYDQWASIILGELLAHGGAESEVNAIPFSRAAACFSSAIARTWIVHGTDGAISTATQRLRKISDDNRFARRSISVQNLEPIWDVLANASDFETDANSFDLVSFVIRQAAGFNSLHSNALTRLLDMERFEGLRSESTEDRVVAYQRMLSEVRSLQGGANDPAVNAIVAGAAFLVGRSTSHAFLLRRVSSEYPAANVWFSLIAALAGPRSWDPNWFRAVKGIEKSLRQRFEWNDPALSDVSWLEYFWATTVYDGPQMLESVSRMTAKVFSIEIMPGALCQLRLSGASEDIVSVEKRNNKEVDFGVKSAELSSSVKEILSLARKMEKVLQVEPQKTTNHSTSRSLFEGDPVLSARPVKKKR